MKTVAERLFSNAVEDKDTGCIEWQRYKTKDGYGRMRGFNHKWEGAHRVAWIVSHGSIPENMHVLHKCDNPSCINVEHLFLGTNADNVADKVAKGRQATDTGVKGEDHYLTTLTEDEIVDIRLMCAGRATYRAISMLYDVSVMTVCNINKRFTWKHVP